MQKATTEWFPEKLLENYTVIIYSLLFWHWRRNKFSLNFGNFHCFEARHCLWYYYEICWFDIYYFKFNAFKGSYIVNALSYPFILINKKLLFFTYFLLLISIFHYFSVRYFRRTTLWLPGTTCVQSYFIAYS